MVVRLFAKRLVCLLLPISFNLDSAMADSSLIRGFEIPDPARPIAEGERGIGPSGELIPFEPGRLQASHIVGRRVDEIVPYVGTYGMGGPGFFGIRLGNEWLTIAIWGASEWITVDGLLVGDVFFGHYGRPEPWISESGDRLSTELVGSTITAIDIEPRSLLMSFSNGLSMSIDEAPDSRPIFEGTKQPRRFVDGDDLRDVIFLSPTTEIWID